MHDPGFIEWQTPEPRSRVTDHGWTLDLQAFAEDRHERAGATDGPGVDPPAAPATPIAECICPDDCARDHEYA